MRILIVMLTICLFTAVQAPLAIAEETSGVKVAQEGGATAAPPAGLRTCAANSADRTQSCSVTCPEGKTATCVGGAQGAANVDCTCK